MKSRFALSLFCLLLLPPGLTRADDITYPTAPLDIKTQDGTLHFTVEVATTPEQQRHGLMFRKNLPPMHGMVFIFTPPEQVNFWMKDTPLALDMLFIDDKGVVAQIVENAAPESTTLIPSTDKVRGVLELRGGAAAQYHIAKGDKVIYSVFP